MTIGRRRHGIAPALLLLWAVPAAAERLNAPLPVMPGACCGEEAQIIATAFRDALAMRQRGMARLDAHPELPEFRRSFGTGPVAPVGAHLPGIADGLSRHRPLAMFGKLPEACAPGRFG
ncbi:MAG: hypothetical protein NZN45_04375 [Rhodovarius sp.]|nr:hypothetical protein [Rhodovarius sp.]